MTPLLSHVRVHVTALASDAFPGWVAFSLIGAHGVVLQFVDKLPVMCDGPITSLPMASSVACPILGTPIGKGCVKLVEVDTSPWGIETDAGVCRFRVRASDLLDPPQAV